MPANRISQIIGEVLDRTENTDGFEDDFYEGLYTAVRERPSIAAICPSLVKSGKKRQIQLLIDLLFDLWRADDRLALSLLQKAVQLSDHELRTDIDECLASHHSPNGEDGSSPEFGAFLTENGF